MKISNLRLDRRPEAARASARIAWEDSARPPFDLFFETDARGSEDLGAEPEAFLTACLLPAVHNGERRILVEGALCPRLVEGLATALALLRSWWGAPRRPIQIEASEGFRAIWPRRPQRAALFLTGGIDSLHLLGTNRALYPAGHPASFADGLSVYGHLCADSDDSPWNERALATLAAIAAQADLSLLPIRTNLWRLEPDFRLVARKSLSAALAASAHLFRRRWTTVSLATGRDVTGEVLRGTHPLLDPLYSSGALEIRHDPIRLTRFERLQAVASFRPGVESLVVCQAYPGPPHLNCGRCEKCVRTMTELLAIGRLSQARHFPSHEVRPEMIRPLPIGAIESAYWNEVLAGLAEQGRDDLTGVIREKLEQARRIALWSKDAGWKGRLRRLDRRWLGGRLLRLRGRIRVGRGVARRA